MIGKKQGLWLALAALAVAPGSAFAQVSDVGQMFVNMQSSIGPVETLAQTFAWLAGVAFFITATIRLAHVEQGREEPRKPMFLYLAAIGLWCLSLMMSTISGTLGATGGLGGSTSPLAAGIGAAGGGSAAVIGAVLNFVQLVGLIAFIRGVWLLKAHGENKDGAMGRALTHLFGGAAAMNIVWTVTVLANTFGASAVMKFL
jgi:hypothetical protein